MVLHLTTADLLIAQDYIMNGPGRWIVTENVQPHVYCEMVRKYSPIFFTNFDVYSASVKSYQYQNFDMLENK